MAATSPSLGESFGKAYRESKDRAKSYALNDKSEKLFDHLVKVRVFTLFRPRYGLSFDLLLLMVGGLWFGILGWAVSFGIVGMLLVYWARNGMHLIPDGFAEFMGNVIGYSIGITAPRRLQPQAAPAPSMVHSGPSEEP